KCIVVFVFLNEVFRNIISNHYFIITVRRRSEQILQLFQAIFAIGKFAMIIDYLMLKIQLIINGIMGNEFIKKSNDFLMIHLKLIGREELLVAQKLYLLTGTPIEQRRKILQIFSVLKNLFVFLHFNLFQSRFFLVQFSIIF